MKENPQTLLKIRKKHWHVWPYFELKQITMQVLTLSVENSTQIFKQTSVSVKQQICNKFPENI